MNIPAVLSQTQAKYYELNSEGTKSDPYMTVFKFPGLTHSLQGPHIHTRARTHAHTAEAASVSLSFSRIYLSTKVNIIKVS